jgi:hypothetical protein
MRRTFLLPALLISVLLPMIPTAAAAQTGFELTPTAGYRFKGDFNANSNFPTGNNHLDVQIDQGGIYGLTFDIPIGPSWRLELLANRQNTSFTVDEGLFDPEVNLGDVTIDYYQIGFLYQWGLGQVNPYIAGAAGIARLDPDFPEVQAEDRFSGSLAGGAKIYFSRNIGLRLEGRGYWTDLKTGFEGRYDRFDSDQGLYQVEGSAGLIIAF